ncbi:MAG: hypothetical protein A3C58_01535 [Candidatus Staskawiczbacteria bacterium RIFCSPHIGHO2_02_FULL_34_10]|uniref:Metal-dependent hydrolase n=2 Tax=Candidatus Staskawicziibacteriota TaxID=1817916 RepID=A0A1G2HMV1_9BACT|nr:MAG: hypothetical protein A2639_02060 [Candidatus Staskawiczbacteria bacterium RIFCSPHIGHO2_01_FULL_34_27]OGZ66216.1 MAG: hypothetical protein A3C58_01535 [Candidatus Staskawiczbacteria bacterium RIFCSPHIGHO2_02_FULL_34_10]
MFLDVGLGIIAVLLVSTLHSATISWAFVGVGIIFALLPDLDFVVPCILKRSFKNEFLHHRERLHYPLLYIPIGALMLYFFSVSLAELFTIASLTHFIHDSIGVGWGVQWLYPFTKDHYSLFYIYKPSFRKKKFPQKLFYIWKNDEIEKLDTEFGDPNWIRNIYFKWHPYAIIEMVVFVVAIIALFWVK